MLQYLTGKYYLEEHQTKKITDKDIFYSNTILIELVENKEKLETPIGTLEIINLNDLYYGSTSYLLTLNGEIPETNHSYEFPSAANQFRILLSFWFKSVFEFEKIDAERRCRQNNTSLKDQILPCNILPEYFEMSKNSKDISSFNDFLNSLFKLTRIKYESVITSITAFINALESIDYNLELSYSLMVFSIESLCQKFDKFENKWVDYPGDVRDKIDKLNKEYNVPNDYSINLQNILLEKEHLKLKNRFIEFVKFYLDNDFFKEEAKNVKNPVRKSELDSVLENVYSTRSGYVHSLEEFDDIQVLMMQKLDKETMNYDKGKFLTISGLARLVHNVLKNFVFQNAELETEEENPLQIKVHTNNYPKNGICNEGSFEKEEIKQYFKRFLIHFEKYSEKENLHELKDFIINLETNMYGVSNRFKSSAFALYYLCNKLYDEEGLSPKFKKISDKSSFNQILNELTIETLLTKLILKEEISWELEDLIECYEKYMKDKSKKKKFILPQYFENIIQIYITNEYYENDIEKFKDETNELILDIPSQVDCQEYLQKCIDTEEKIEIEKYYELFEMKII